jgi:hypothetical protein
MKRCKSFPMASEHVYIIVRRLCCCKLRWCLAIWELEWDLKIELEKVRDAVCWPTW